jgi:hypothetical protein
MLTTVDDYIKQKLVHSIHTTGRRSFRGCRRRWSWIFNDYYYPTITAKPLEFGVAFHLAMEKLYEPSTWAERANGVPLAEAKVAFKNKTEEQKKAFKKVQGELEPEAEKDYRDRVKLGLGMLNYYAEKIMPSYDSEFTPVKVEVAFEVPITSPQGEQLWCKCDDCWMRHERWWNAKYPARGVYIRREDWKGLPVTYGGRIDMLAQDQYGRYWIFDWKTAAQLTKEESDGYLLTEDQITSYCWAFWILGIDVVGFVYAEIKKAVPSEPEPLTRRYKGRLYSTNKQEAYDATLYRRTVEENDTQAYLDGCYDEFLEYLETVGETTFHRRHQVDRNEDELRAAHEHIWLEACDMIDNPRIYPQPSKFSCASCAFQQPCVAKNRGEDVEYLLASLYDKRERHYYETAEKTTEKAGRA